MVLFYTAYGLHICCLLHLYYFICFHYFIFYICNYYCISKLFGYHFFVGIFLRLVMNKCEQNKKPVSEGADATENTETN